MQCRVTIADEQNTSARNHHDEFGGTTVDGCGQPSATTALRSQNSRLWSGLYVALLWSTLAGCVPGGCKTEASACGEGKKVGFTSSDGVASEVIVEYVGERVVFQDDIILGTPAEFGPSRGAVTIGERWPDARVPLEVAEGIPDEQRANIVDAIRHWEEKTPLRFPAHAAEDANFIRFVNGDRCASGVGVPSSGGARDVVLNVACDKGAIMHEIGHAIGLWHEHTRQDRDNALVIHWDNIQTGKEHNFCKYTSGRDIGNHDYASIMHYGPTYFGTTGSGGSTNPTISRRDGKALVVQREHLSFGDVCAALWLYARDQYDARCLELRPEPDICEPTCMQGRICCRCPELGVGPVCLPGYKCDQLCRRR